MSVPTNGFRIVGGCMGERRLVDHSTAAAAYAACDPRAEVHRESYLSAFTFGEDFRNHLEVTGSSRGFTGMCSAPVLWFDIDYAEDLPKAQREARQLVLTLAEEFRINPEKLLLFFSGSKGFHVGLPCSLWVPEPSTGFNRVARTFCENVAEMAGVTIDTSVYDKVRAFRAPNSRHPQTGLYKRLLTLNEVEVLNIHDIRTLAGQPAPFAFPVISHEDADVGGLREKWNLAATEFQGQIRIPHVQQASDATANRLNRRTMEFINNGAPEGTRHTCLFSAAANLGEFDCPPALAFALLEEISLNCGLPPSEVRQTINDGLNHARRNAL